MTPNAYGHSWPQQDDDPSSSHLDRTETLAEIHSYDYRDTPQYEYSDYTEPRTAFDPFAGAVWVPDPPPPPPPPPPLAPTSAPAPVPYYGPELYYQRLNFGPPPPPEEEEENAALAYRTSTTALTPTTAYQTATAAAEIPCHQQQRYPPPPQYSYQHFQRYPLAASEYPPGANDQQYTHVDKRPRVDEEDAGAPGTFTSLSGYRASGDDRSSSSSSYFHLPISRSDPPPRHSIPIPTPISFTDSGPADSEERAGPPPLSHSASAGARWYRQDPLLPPPPPQPGPAARFSSSHVERVYNGDISGEGERGGGGAGGGTVRAQQQQQQRPSLATLSSGSNSTLGSATTTVSSSSFSALSSTSLSSIAPNPNPNLPPSGSPLAPPAPAVAASTRPQQQQQNGPLSYTPQQQRQMSVTVDHRPGGPGEAIIESEHLRAERQSQQSREGGGGGIMSPPSSSQPAAVAHGQLPPPPNQNQPKKTQVSKSEKSCKACRSVRVRAYRSIDPKKVLTMGSTARCAGSAKSVARGRGRAVRAAPRNASTATTAI